MKSDSLFLWILVLGFFIWLDYYVRVSPGPNLATFALVGWIGYGLVLLLRAFYRFINGSRERERELELARRLSRDGRGQ